MGQVCPMLVYATPSAANEKLLRAVLERNPHHTAQAQACFALGKYLRRQEQLARLLSNDEAQRQRIEQFYGEDYVQHLAELDIEKASQEAEKLFERVIEKHSDVPSLRGTLADRAKSELFELRHLAIGKQAPEIEGEDIDGQQFKLSDYRGKVVVLDFWGHW
jgi:hypothetical protein